MVTQISIVLFEFDPLLVFDSCFRFVKSCESVEISETMNLGI